MLLFKFFFSVNELKEFWCVPDLTARLNHLQERACGIIAHKAEYTVERHPCPTHVPFNLFFPEDENGAFVILY